MFDQLISLLALFAIALAAYGVGYPILRGLGLGGHDRLAAAVWSLALGLVLCGTLLAGLGLLGLLVRPLIGVLSVLGCFWGIQCIGFGQTPAPGNRTDSLSDAIGPANPWSRPPRWLNRGILLAAAVACLGSLIAALAPPTAGDALCYHLELPKEFLAGHGLDYLPQNENSTFPLLVEMWYAWALVLDGPVAAGLIHWGLGILLGLSTVVLATPVIARPWAWVAGAVVLLVPGVGNQMTAPMNDLGLALLTTLALAAWCRAVVGHESRRWFLLAGLAAGGALATKYLALVFVLAVALPTAWAFLRQSRQRRLLIQGAAVVTIVAASIGGLWYVRAAYHRGNPVYPFLAELFDAAGPPGAGLQQTLPQSKSPLGRGAVGLAIAPWQVTMHPEQFGGRGHQLGPLFLVALPGLLFARRLRGLGFLLGVALSYAILWFLLRQNVRFLLPVLPILALAVTWVCMELRRFPRVPRLLAAAAFALILAASATVALRRSRDQAAVALGLQSRQEYLLRHEPTWTAAEVSNSLFGPDARMLSQDYRAFYFQCHVTREHVYRRQTGYDRAIAEPADFSRTLRQAGFTHLLLAENLTQRGIQYDPVLSRLADAELAAGETGSLLELADYRFQDPDGAVRRYRLLMLR
jgi:hypothetical protein